MNSFSFSTFIVKNASSYIFSVLISQLFVLVNRLVCTLTQKIAELIMIAITTKHAIVQGYRPDLCLTQKRRHSFIPGK